MTASQAGLDAAARLLLRSLNDPAALRGNRLVSKLFGPAVDPAADGLVLARIRRRVEALAERLETEETRYPHRAEALRRQRTILEECDLGGRAHKVVARELGLGRRQFYRERKCLRRRIAEWLTSPDAAPPALCVDSFSAGFAYLQSLRNAGSTEQLIRDGTHLLGEIGGARRIDVANLLVEVYSECGDLHHADELADLLLNESRRIGDVKGEWGRAYVEQMQGRYPAAAKAFLRIVKRCGNLPEDPVHSIDELQARASLEFAQCAHMMGDNEAAQRGWQMAADMIASDSLTPSTRLQTLWQLAAASMMSGRGLDEAALYIDDAVSEAVRHNLPRELADVLIARANVHRKRKDFQLAVADARSALDLARRVFGENARAWRVLNVASVELAAGNARRAIDLVRDASAARGSNPVRDGFGEWIESSALLATGEIQAALPVSLRAIEDLRAAQNQRHLGASLRVYAEVASHSRHKREAIKAIDEAVELLSRYGLPKARENALRSRAAILTR